MHYLTSELWFPHPSQSDEDGLLAIGGDLSPERLLLAYGSGIFPWFEKGQPILWWSPNPRMVLFPNTFKVSKSFRQTLRKDLFQVTFNQNFEQVVDACSTIHRPGQDGTWITHTMKSAYGALHQLGHAQSVEVWQDERLVGGLYGIRLPEQKLFCGESMFSRVSEASKVGFYYLTQQLKKEGYRLIDCQMYTEHLARLGAQEMTREDFLQYLNVTL